LNLFFCIFVYSQKSFLRHELYVVENIIKNNDYSQAIQVINSIDKCTTDKYCKFLKGFIHLQLKDYYKSLLYCSEVRTFF
jgi:hypothetical protein